MEYYDLNSNQQKQQEDHNKRELERFNYIFNIKENIKYNGENFNFYINNYLFHFVFSYNKLNISSQDFYTEFNNNVIQEIEQNKLDNKKFEITSYVNYYSKYLNKKINYGINYVYFYEESNYDCEKGKIMRKQKQENYQKLTSKNDLFVEIFTEEFLNDILIFLYDINFNSEYIRHSIIFRDKYFYYNELIKDNNIKTLSEKRRMKSILENF